MQRVVVSLSCTSSDQKPHERLPIRGGGMNKTDAVMEHLKKYGSIRWRRILAMGIKNPPDTIYRLRKRGHRIETVMREKDGVKYAEAYRWHAA